MCGELFAMCRIVRVEKARWDPEPNGLTSGPKKVDTRPEISL